MTGFLDLEAPSIDAEYARYLDSDILGKMLFKSFMLYIVGGTPELYIPLGKHGDPDAPRVLVADAQVQIETEWIDVEIKCSRLQSINRTQGSKRKGWAFSGLASTPSGEPRKYDIAFACGVNLLGFEDSAYWQHIQDIDRFNAKTRQTLSAASQTSFGFTATTLPHEPEFLSECTFFIIPFAAIKRDGFRANPKTSNNQYTEYQAKGKDREACCSLWAQAIAASK